MYDEREFCRIEAETNSIRHNIINLIFLLDTSDSMSGERINEVNAVMSDLTDFIQKVEKSYFVRDFEPFSLTLLQIGFLAMRSIMYAIINFIVMRTQSKVKFGYHLLPEGQQ